MRRRNPRAPRFFPATRFFPRAPDVKSVEEIRWWLKMLHEQRGWPWETLGRTLGIGEGKHVASKVRGNSRFVGGEQIRCTRQLRRIISGELVPVERRNSQGGKRWDAVIADHPQPLRPGLHWHVDLKRGTAYLEPTEPPPPMLPNFRNMLENPRPWKNPWPGSERAYRLKRRSYGDPTRPKV
jgi:hypothetical protein